MPHLALVATSHIDKAWRDGAHMLSEACQSGEVTPDQLKMLLSRGERVLLAIMDGEQPAGWVVARVDQYPNLRAMHVCEMYAPGAMFHECYEQFVAYARDNGCSEIRCAAKPAQARLYGMRFGFEPLYQVLRVSI